MDKLKERVQLIRDAVAFKETDRIPTHSNYWTYVFLDAGYNLEEAIYDYSKAEDALRKFQEKYDFDFTSNYGTRNPMAVADAVGASMYSIDDSKERLNLKDYHLMEEDEYPELIDNPEKFMWEKVMARKCKAFHHNNAYDAFEKGIAEYDKYLTFTGKMSKMFLEEYHMPKLSFRHQINTPMEMLTNQLRGLKGISIDIRRRYSQVKEALQAIYRYRGQVTIADAIRNTPLPNDAIFGIAMIWVDHTLLNRKQFDEIYWPYANSYFNAAFETGKQAMLFTEGEVLRFIDHFQEYEKGMFLLQPEMDDVFELRNKCPNIAINGGMSPDYLGKKSKQECLDCAKRLVNELGANGGFIMGQTKMMSYRGDAKSENIAAIQEFCRTYK